MRTPILLAALTLVTVAIPVLAADPPTQSTRIEKTGAKMREKFDAADTDHDGLLSREETARGMPHLSKHFDEIDANHDGKLSAQEILQFVRSKRAANSETP